MIEQKTFITIVAAIVTAEIIMTFVYHIIGRSQGNHSSLRSQDV